MYERKPPRVVQIPRYVPVQFNWSAVAMGENFSYMKYLPDGVFCFLFDEKWPNIAGKRKFFFSYMYFKL